MSVEHVCLGTFSPLCLKNDELQDIQKESFKQPCDKKVKNNTKLVIEFSNEEIGRLIMIHRRQEELTSLKETVEKKIELIEDEIDELQKQIGDEILKTIRSTNAISEKKQNEIKKAIKKVMALYVDSKGTMSKQWAQTLLAREIGSINTFLPSVISGSLYSSYGKISDLRLKMNVMANLTGYSSKINAELCQNNAILNKYYNPYDDFDTDFGSSCASDPISQIKVIGNNMCLNALSSMQYTAQRIKNGEDFRLHSLTNNGAYEIKCSKDYEEKSSGKITTD